MCLKKFLANKMFINITIPTYNEENILEKSISELFEFCQENLRGYNWKIIIADNKSLDKTGEIGRRLAKNSEIEYLFVNQKGKGRAIREAWQKYRGDIYFFMDADLATDLEALPRFLSLMEREDHDIVIGSRAINGAEVKRGFPRKIISWFLGLILRLIFNSSIKDHPCGFKAINRKAADALLPLVKNNEWFFDTELLLWAKKKNFKIKELPVKWQEKVDRKSSVGIFGVIVAYLKEMVRLKRRFNKISNVKS